MIRHLELDVLINHNEMVAETSELEITTTEIIKRRDVGPYGIRSEYCMRKIICPIGVPETPKGNYVYIIPVRYREVYIEGDFVIL